MFFPHTVLPSDEGSGILGALTLMEVSAVIKSHGTPVAALQQLYVQKDVKPMVLGLVGDSEASQASIANSLTGQTIWHSFKAPNRPLVHAAYRHCHLRCQCRLEIYHDAEKGSSARYVSHLIT